jgi:beta-glucosidase-like glycosyl hydrolase
MGGVLAAGTIEEIAVETIRAGADIFLVCHNQELVWRAYEAVLRQAEKDGKFARRVTQAAERVLQFKRRSRELHYFPARPKERTVKMLKRMTTNYAAMIEEHQA